MKVVMRIGLGGSVRATYHPDYAIGPKVRASNVLPGRRAKQRAFLTLRWLFGEEGRVAAWTRRWRGPWHVDMSPLGPEFCYCLLTRSDDRATALQIEHDYVVQHWVRWQPLEV